MHKFPDDALLHTEAMVAIKHAANKKMKKIQCNVFSITEKQPHFIKYCIVVERKKFKPQSEIEREIESISGGKSILILLLTPS